MILAVAATAVGLMAAVGWLLWLVARPPRRRSTGDLALHQLGDGVYMYRGHFSNSAFFVMDGGVVVVDTQVSPTAGRRLREMIASVTDLPVRYVINTHYHGDHTGGNALFPEAEIVATAQTAQFVIERDQERLDYANRFGLEIQQWHATVGPTRTFAGRLELAVGADRFEVVQIGAAETPDACVVHWPARGVVACGDGVATWDYPYTGVPFLDEGLRDDGEWIRFLGSVRAMKPSILIAGHGPALAGEREITDRLDLLIALWSDLCAAVRREVAAGTPIPQLVDKVDTDLAHYRQRKDLAQTVTGQRFAIYRVLNNMLPERAGKGWWDDLRPSVVVRAPRERVEAELARIDSSDAICRRARELVAIGDRALAHGLLECWSEHHADDAAALGLLADICFDGGIRIVPRVDGTEYLALANRASRRALAIDDGEPLALLSLGMSEVLGAMVLAQPMAAGIDKLERALASGRLTAFQRRKAAFFLGKAHQYQFESSESDAWFRRVLPVWARPAFPLVPRKNEVYTMSEQRRELVVIGRRALVAPAVKPGRSLIAAANAMLRAQETVRPETDRILDDPWAAHMVDRDWRLRLIRSARHVVPPLRRTIDDLQVAHCVRHRAIDELVCQAVERDRFNQVVTIGAGYDMRPYRFGDRLPDVRWFEFDHPATQAFKQSLLADLPEQREVHRAPVDLTAGTIASAMAATPFDPWQSTCFVIEGLIHYLTMAQLEALFGVVASASRRVRVVFSYIRSDVYASRTTTLTWLVKRLREVPTLHFSVDRIHQRLARHRLDRFMAWDHEEQIAAFAPRVTRRARLSQDVVQVDAM